ncbi:hypothetical protein ACWDBT_34645 [Streptomyces ardesiacus]
MQNTRRALQTDRNDSTKGTRITVPVFSRPAKTGRHGRLRQL